jgi:hypothetical protein
LAAISKLRRFFGPSQSFAADLFLPDGCIRLTKKPTLGTAAHVEKLDDHLPAYLYRHYEILMPRLSPSVRAAPPDTASVHRLHIRPNWKKSCAQGDVRSRLATRPRAPHPARRATNPRRRCLRSCQHEMLQTPSRSMTVIGTASHAARYSTARFLSDDFASMAATDRVRTSCRGCRASARTPRSSSRIPKRRRVGRPWRVRPMPCYVEGGGCSNLWAAFGADRWAWFIRKKLKLNPKSPPGLKRWNSPNLPARAGPIHVCFRGNSGRRISSW